MSRKHDMVMELFADNPNREDWCFQIAADLNIFECFENSQESELGSFSNSRQLVIVIQQLITVKAIRACPPGQKHIDQLLSAMTVVAD